MQLRVARGLLQAEVSTATGLGRGSLGKLETGDDIPGREALQALGRFYGVSMDYLQNGTTLPGDNVALDPAEHEKEAIFLRFLRRLSPEKREVVASVMHGLLKP